MLSRGGASPAIDCSIGECDPFAEGREIVWSDGVDTFAGRGSLGGKSFEGAYPHTEMMVVSGGTVRVSSNGRTTELSAGHAAVIPAGGRVSIEGDDASWSFYAAVPAASDGTSEAKQPVFMTGKEPLEPSPPPSAEVLTTDAPVCGVVESAFDTATGSRYGIWAATPYARNVQVHKGHEMMHVIEGGMTLFDDDGLSFKLEPGDTVLVPKGSPCGWASTVAMRKYYAGT